MSALNHVAQEMAGDSDLDVLQRKLTLVWGQFEALAKANHYEILEGSQHDGEQPSRLLLLMRDLVGMLYRVPDSSATWANDVGQLVQKNMEYGGSWCKRGGPNAFFMLCRKWDRIEEALKKSSLKDLIQKDTREEGIRDDIGDLRRYLLLVLSWHHARDVENGLLDPDRDIPF